MVWIPFGVHIEAQVFDSHHRAVDVSLKFPHSEVIGLDIVPPVLRDGNLPSNCRFEIDDCNLSFTHWVNTFDFVHARSVDTAIHDFPTFLYNMAQIMRPGAVLIVGSGLPHFFDENRQPHPDVEEGEEGFSWLQKAVKIDSIFEANIPKESHLIFFLLVHSYVDTLSEHHPNPKSS
ncbi:hypothetical protein FRC02_007671 [Tulasnella sp. 418]|nr:hypothetical protein FRC02_007671 [Tulasnella sp. 418]